MPLNLTLASRNLFHDRLRFIATMVGIVFSVVLVMVQMGLYLGFGRMVTTVIEHTSTDLWVMRHGTKCFEDPSGSVAGLVGIEGGVVSGVINLESSGVEASDWRPRHDEHYHEA